MKYIVKCLLAFGLLLPAMAEEITLTNGEWPPYLSEYEPHYGIASRIVSEAFAQEGVTVRYVFRPWRRAYAEAESGKYNGSVVWTYEPDRGEKFYFSDTVFEGKSVFFHLKSNPVDWKTFDDLANLRIGGTNGYNYEFEKNPKIKVERANSDVENFRKLLAGRFDFFPSDLNVGYALLQKNFVTAEMDQITHHPKVYNVVNYFLILSKANPDNIKLMVRFNRGLKKLHESGKYEEYFSLPYQTAPSADPLK